MQRSRSSRALIPFCCLFLFTILVFENYSPRASSNAVPKIDRERTILKAGKKQLIIVGENFESGMSVQMLSKGGNLTEGQVTFQDTNTIIINGVKKSDFPDGVATIVVRNPSGGEAKETLAIIPSAIGPSPLTREDIEQIIGQGAAAAAKLGFPATFAILDREGNVLALYQMRGAPKVVIVRDLGKEGHGLEGLGGSSFNGFVPSFIAAISKAADGSFFGTQGNAFSTRTAAYIIRDHFPPFVENRPAGPLFGTQVSSLACSDVKMPGVPLGLSGDTGGFPIYKNGIMAGGLGVEANGNYNIALNRPVDFSKELTPVDPKSDIYVREDVEEMIALAALKHFEAPDAITADKILVNGVRFPYTRLAVKDMKVPDVQPIPFNQIPGKLLPIPVTGNAEIRTDVPTEFRDIMLRDRRVRVVNRFFPFKEGTTITASEAEQILFQAVKEANRVRAAIRRPIEVPAEVNLVCIDETGKILGLVSTPDAPIFGFDVCVEKARSAVFFSRTDALDNLRKMGLGKYADNFNREAFPLGQFMLTTRSIGWISRPFYPDGVEDSQEAGPPVLSVAPADFSPLNNGFQTDYLLQGANKNPDFMVGNTDLSFVIGRSIVNTILGRKPTADQHFCDATNGRIGNDLLNNTLMIFSGGVPMYKNGHIAGAVGTSGDGIDQDNIISAYGTIGFEVPDELRADRIFYRGIRVPFNKFPRHPHLGEEGDE